MNQSAEMPESKNCKPAHLSTFSLAREVNSSISYGNSLKTLLRVCIFYFIKLYYAVVLVCLCFHLKNSWSRIKLWQRAQDGINTTSPTVAP